MITRTLPPDARLMSALIIVAVVIGIAAGYGIYASLS